jgi:hypothetical protein
MIRDPIIEELERLREQEMARHGNDPQRFFAALQEAQRNSKRPIQPAPEPRHKATSKAASMFES